MDSRKTKSIVVIGAISMVLCATLELVQAGQGCPFDNASCQDYCSQQGCNYGYCGHFAWIQCICRKCGDEWGYYDKVHYNPDKQVNQTELDSLKLNRSEPLILTNNEQQIRQQQQQQQQQKEQKHATLTTLLIPDLSDSSKLDLNDIPDENSEKFLDFLAKNHEKLVQATSQQQQQSRTIGQMVAIDLAAEEQQQATSRVSGAAATTTTTVAPQTDEPVEETVEIQISSSNNNNTNVNKRNSDDDDDEEQEAVAAAAEQTSSAGTSAAGTVTRLLRMAVAERSSEEIERKR